MQKERLLDKRTIATFIVASLLILFCVKFFWLVGTVPTESMEPMIPTNSIIVANRLAYKKEPVKKGDIVTFYKDGKILVKRVIATGGDKLKISNNKVYLNDALLEEPYITQNTSGNMEYLIPEGYLFVMGDNRGNSLDSRSFGCIEEKKVLGRAFVVLNLKEPSIKTIERYELVIE